MNRKKEKIRGINIYFLSKRLFEISTILPLSNSNSNFKSLEFFDLESLKFTFEYFDNSPERGEREIDSIQSIIVFIIRYHWEESSFLQRREGNLVSRVGEVYSADQSIRFTGPWFQGDERFCHGSIKASHEPFRRK